METQAPYLPCFAASDPVFSAEECRKILAIGPVVGRPTSRRHDRHAGPRQKRPAANEALRDGAPGMLASVCGDGNA